MDSFSWMYAGQAAAWAFVGIILATASILTYFKTKGSGGGAAPPEALLSLFQTMVADRREEMRETRRLMEFHQQSTMTLLQEISRTMDTMATVMTRIEERTRILSESRFLSDN